MHIKKALTGHPMNQHAANSHTQTLAIIANVNMIAMIISTMYLLQSHCWVYSSVSSSIPQHAIHSINMPAWVWGLWAKWLSLAGSFSHGFNNLRWAPPRSWRIQCWIHTQSVAVAQPVRWRMFRERDMGAVCGVRSGETMRVKCEDSLDRSLLP